MIAKVGLGLIGLSAISVGGVAIAKPYWLGMRDPMPEYHTLDKDNGYSTTYGSGSNKFGKKYGKYLVGVTHKENETNQTNKNWWDWAYRRLQANKPATNSKFSAVDDDYRDTNTQALNKVCDEAYKKEDGDFQDTPATDKFTKEEVWKYCSIGGTQPQTIKEFNTKKPGTEAEESYSNSTNDAIANGNDEKGKLLSIKSPSNDWIWDLKDKEFRNTTINEEGYFKTESKKTGNERRALKEICKDAYSKKEGESGAGQITKTNVTKYCSLEQITA